MAEFDLAIGLDATALAQISAVVHQKLYPDVFTGSMEVPIGDQPLKLSWDITRPPAFILSAPDNAPDVLRTHLDAHAPALQARLDTWADNGTPMTMDALHDALASGLRDSIFQMLLPGFNLTIHGTPPTTQPLQVTIYVQASSAGGVLSLTPIKAIAIASDPADQGLVDRFIVPQALAIARTLLQSLTLPPLSAGPVDLTPPNIFVLQDRVIAVAALAGRPIPTLPQGIAWPAGAFFAVLSDDLRLALARVATAEIVGQGFSTSGSVGTSIGGASYGASGRLNSAKPSLVPDPKKLGITVSVGGNCHADVTLACVPIGANYNLSTNPSPLNVLIELRAQGNSIVGACQSIQEFTIILEPSGNVLELVLSAITWPITQLVAAAFSPTIRNELSGISFAMPLPSFPYAIGGLKLTFRPVGVSLGTASGRLAASGALAVS